MPDRPSCAVLIAQGDQAAASRLEQFTRQPGRVDILKAYEYGQHNRLQQSRPQWVSTSRSSSEQSSGTRQPSTNIPAQSNPPFFFFFLSPFGFARDIGFRATLLSITVDQTVPLEVCPPFFSFLSLLEFRNIILSTVFFLPTTIFRSVV